MSISLEWWLLLLFLLRLVVLVLWNSHLSPPRNRYLLHLLGIVVGLCGIHFRGIWFRRLRGRFGHRLYLHGRCTLVRCISVRFNRVHRRLVKPLVLNFPSIALEIVRISD